MTVFFFDIWFVINYRILKLFQLDWHYNVYSEKELELHFLFFVFRENFHQTIFKCGLILPVSFQDQSEHSFKEAMKLEAVNPLSPENVHVATVTKVKGQYVWLNLEGELESWKNGLSLAKSLCTVRANVAWRWSVLSFRRQDSDVKSSNEIVLDLTSTEKFTHISVKTHSWLNS